MNKPILFIGLAAVGVAAFYFLQPEEGKPDPLKDLLDFGSKAVEAIPVIVSPALGTVTSVFGGGTQVTAASRAAQAEKDAKLRAKGKTPFGFGGY